MYSTEGAQRRAASSAPTPASTPSMGVFFLVHYSFVSKRYFYRSIHICSMNVTVIVIKCQCIFDIELPVSASFYGRNRCHKRPDRPLSSLQRRQLQMMLSECYSKNNSPLNNPGTMNLTFVWWLQLSNPATCFQRLFRLSDSVQWEWTAGLEAEKEAEKLEERVRDGSGETVSCRLSGSRWSHILNHRLHCSYEDRYLTSGFACCCCCCCFSLARLCCCTFLTCSHRLADFNPVTMDYSSSSRVDCHWRDRKWAPSRDHRWLRRRRTDRIWVSGDGGNICGKRRTQFREASEEPVEGPIWKEAKRKDDGMAVTTWKRKSVVVYFHPASDSTQLTWGTGTEREEVGGR